MQTALAFFDKGCSYFEQIVAYDVYMTINVSNRKYGIGVRDHQAGKHLKADHHRPSSETTFKWRFAGRPMVAQHCVLAGQHQINLQSV